MRRSIVFPSLLLAASLAAIWVLALAGPAGARPHIICPQQRQGPSVVPPCCPLPPQPAAGDRSAQPICCTTTQCCQATCCSPTTCPVATPTITSSPNPSRAGQQVVISGTSTSGAPVALWRKRAGQSTFTQVSTTNADGSGKYTFTLARGTVMADQQWYVTSGAAQSQTVSQQVRAVVSVAASQAGHTIALHGHVTPSHAGEVVLIEMSRGGAWRVIARPHLGHGSSYSASHRFARSGTVRFRVVLNRDLRNEQSTSPTLKVTVKS